MDGGVVRWADGGWRDGQKIDSWRILSINHVNSVLWIKCPRLITIIITLFMH